MNHFSYEVFSKEKVNNLREEGMRNQAVYGSSTPKRFLRSLTKFILAILGIIGIVGMLIR